MANTGFDYDFTNINDILDEKVQLKDIFHFSLIQKVLEESIKRQNSMNKKINSLETKFDTWSLTHDLGGGDIVENNNFEEKKEINQDDVNKIEPEQKINVDINVNNEDFEKKMKEINKKIKKLESITKELAQRLILINNKTNENISDFISNSEERINQMNANLKNFDYKLSEKERSINNQTKKMDQLFKKFDLISLTVEEHKQNIKSMNTDLFNLQCLNINDLVNEFYSYKNQNDKDKRDIKQLIEEKINNFTNRLLKKKDQDSDNPEENIDIDAPVNEFQLRDMGNELKSHFSKSISETTKSLRKLIDDLNISKINNNIANIQKELKDKLTQQNLTTLNIKMEDFDTKLVEFNSLIKDCNQNFDSNREHMNKIDKNFEFLSMHVNGLMQNESKKEKKSNDLMSSEGIKLFIKKDIYEQDITKIYKKLEKIFLFQQDNLTKIEGIEKKMKLFVSDKEIKNIEQYTLNMIQEFKITSSKKFLDKKEGLKSIKLLGLQIKNINEYLNLSNVIISTERNLKQNPLNNYICPNCDNMLTSQVKNQNNEYIPSKKKEKQDLQNYRMGQGFSHMLQLINTDLMKSAEKISDDISMKIDENNYNNENNNKSMIENKSLPRINSQKSFSIINAEAKSNDLDSSNLNISGHINENNFKTLKTNSIDRLLNNKLNFKNKIFKSIEKNTSLKDNKNQVIYTKLMKK